MPHVAARRALICLVLAGAALAAHGDMYKWVDEKGVTHYSETPPPDGKAKRLALPKDAPHADAPAPNWTQRELEFRKRHLDQQDVDAKSGEDQARRKQRCLQAQRQLEVLKAQVPIFRVNERGERIYLEDKDRAEQLKTWQQRADENCR